MCRFQVWAFEKHSEDKHTLYLLNFCFYFTALYWAIYETYKNMLQTPQLTMVQSFAGGALAGTVMNYF